MIVLRRERDVPKDFPWGKSNPKSIPMNPYRYHNYIKSVFMTCNVLKT
jgi:hypothetical protein